MRGAKGVIRGETWRDPASLLISRIRMEIYRAGGKISWGGGEGGDGAASVAGEADRFEVGHFGCGVRGGTGDSPLKVSDAVGWQWGLALVETAIGLKTNCAVICCCVATSQNSNGNIGCLRESRDGVWE